MSVKFEKEMSEGLAEAAGAATKDGHKNVFKEVGNAITKGGGANGYLAVSAPQCMLHICAHILT
jgi:hypothetical protein